MIREPPPTHLENAKHDKEPKRPLSLSPVRSRFVPLTHLSWNIKHFLSMMWSCQTRPVNIWRFSKISILLLSNICSTNVSVFYSLRNPNLARVDGSPPYSQCPCLVYFPAPGKQWPTAYNVGQNQVCSNLGQWPDLAFTFAIALPCFPLGSNS